MLIRRKPGEPLVVEPGVTDLRYVGLRVVSLAPGQGCQFPSEPHRETGAVLLGGAGALTIGGRFHGSIAGRASVFEAVPPYVWYVPPGTPWAFEAGAGGAELAVARAVAEDPAPPARVVSPAEIAVEHRGEGVMARRVHHLLEGEGQASHLLLVEVVTPEGHWSSFPPHKHDREDPPREAYLEEIYYFRVQPASGWMLQRVYSPEESGEVYAVYDGDAVTVPRGYHPVACPPGVVGYYLNAMAGPQRVWNFTVDPAFSHVPGFKKP